MGILGLSKLLGDYAPSAMKENEFKNYFGKILALFSIGQASAMAAGFVVDTATGMFMIMYISVHIVI